MINCSGCTSASLSLERADWLEEDIFYLISAVKDMRGDRGYTELGVPTPLLP